MKVSKTREELVKMYIDSLKEGEIPWRKRWTSSLNVNGVSNIEYRGINQLLLSLVTYNNKYNDNRWLTFKQIKDKGYKIKDGKGKGVPIEFWSVYDIENKRRLNLNDYEKILIKNPELKDNYRLFCNTSYVFNGSLIEGLPELEQSKNKKESSKFINKLIKNLGVKYYETGEQAYYVPTTDEVFIPPSEKFIDVYSYYATQLHELCHATGHKNRLNRKQIGNDKKDYAREELIAEISSSFLMAELGINPSDDYNNHKSYIQSWINILEDKPSELFKAINESNKVCDYIDNKQKIKEKER